LSSVELLREVAKVLTAYDIVVRVEFLGGKIRAYLLGDYIFDVYYNQILEKYSYTLIKENKRILGWDNAPHHVNVETYPKHFHDVNGAVKPSYLSGDPLKDLDYVIKAIKDILAK